MPVQDDVELIKKELSEKIIEHLKAHTLDADAAQKQAAEFLAALPVTDYKDLLAKLEKLGETYEESQEVFVKELGRVNDQQKDHALNTMRDHIQQGNIDQAIQVAKGVTTQQ